MIFVSRLTDCVHFLQRLFFLSFLFAFLISPQIFRRTARQVQRDFHYAWSGFWIGIGVLVDWWIGGFGFRAVICCTANVAPPRWALRNFAYLFLSFLMESFRGEIYDWGPVYVRIYPLNQPASCEDKPENCRGWELFDCIWSSLKAN